MAEYIVPLAMADKVSVEAWFLHRIMSRNRALYGVTPNIVYFEFGVYEGDPLLKICFSREKILPPL